MSERAQELGVPHLNSDFCIPRADLYKISTGQLSERIISSLYKRPSNLEFHRTVDVEFLDELGPIAAELLNARDIVLRYIRNSTRPNGGKLDIVTFDHLQTHPIQGTHPLLSPFLSSIYTFHRLQQAVRACHAAWRRIQDITRLSPTELASPEVETEFTSLLTKHCNFVAKEEDAPQGALFVYGKNAPVRSRQQQKIKALKKLPPTMVLTHLSKDIERNFEGKEREASASTTRMLDKAIREPSCLYLYVGGRYRLTYNHKSGMFSNGQLAFLHELPDPLALAHHRPISMLVAPPGCSHIPTETDTPQTLMQAGWTAKEVGISPDNPQKLRTITAKRTRQYGLQLYVGSTWHSTMGKTLAQVATQVSSRNCRSDPYSIWDPTQVVIMLSRTRLPHDTTFITSKPNETAKALFSILRKTSPLRDYLAYLVNNLCGIQTPDTTKNTIDQRQSIFVPRDVLLPPDNTGFVYILISLKGNVVYIGSCFNILLRLQRHNSGFGALQTAPEALRPWAVLAYISGFQGMETHFRQLENEWIAAKNRQLQSNRLTTTPTDIVALGHSLMEQYNQSHNLQLSFVHAGALQNSAGPTSAIHSDSPGSEQDQDTQFCDLQSTDNAILDATESEPVSIEEQGSSESDCLSSCEKDSDGDDSDSVDKSENVPSIGSDLSDHGRDDHFFADEELSEPSDSDDEPDLDT